MVVTAKNGLSACVAFKTASVLAFDEAEVKGYGWGNGEQYAHPYWDIRHEMCPSQVYGLTQGHALHNYHFYFT
jgi:hypothetical protein